MSFDDMDIDEHIDRLLDADNSDEIALIEESESAITASATTIMAKTKKKTGKGRGKSTTPLRPGNIVWFMKLRQKMPDGKWKEKRAIKADDLKKTALDFMTLDEEIWADLFVVNQKSEVRSNSKKWTTHCTYVGGGVLKAKHVPNAYLFKIRNIEELHTFWSVVQRSVDGRMVQSDHQKVYDKLKNQVDQVIDYFRLVERYGSKMVPSQHFLSLTKREALTFTLSLSGPMRTMTTTTIVDCESDAEVIEDRFKRQSQSSSQNKRTTRTRKKSGAKKKLVVDNDEIISWFGKKPAQRHLKNVMLGKFASKRHVILMNDKDDFGIHSDIVRLAQANFLEDDGSIDLILFDLVSESVYDNCCDKLPRAHEAGYRRNYVNYVLIPEGIVRFLSEKYSLSMKTAEERFLETRITEEDLDLFQQEVKQQKQAAAAKRFKMHSEWGEEPRVLEENNVEKHDFHEIDLESGSEDNSNSDFLIDVCDDFSIDVCDVGSSDEVKLHNGCAISADNETSGLLVIDEENREEEEIQKPKKRKSLAAAVEPKSRKKRSKNGVKISVVAKLDLDEECEQKWAVSSAETSDIKPEEEEKIEKPVTKSRKKCRKRGKKNARFPVVKLTNICQPSLKRAKRKSRSMSGEWICNQLDSSSTEFIQDKPRRRSTRQKSWQTAYSTSTST